MMDSSAPPIFVNGRFLGQPLTGVQRVAHEVTRVLRTQYGSRLRLLGPARQQHDSDQMAEVIGSQRGQAWEQFDLPRYSRHGILLNFGNTAPLMHKRQLVLIHDAGIFSTPEAYSRKFRVWYRVLHTLLCRSGAKIVTVSQFSKSELVRNLKLDAADVHVMPPGADHMARIEADATILDRFRLAPGQFVLAVGTLAAHKNLAALAPLSLALAKMGIPLAITGSLGGMAFNPAASGKLPQAARYLGRVSDAQLKALFNAAACLIIPSLYEGFGLPAAEAMSCGCPVIAADIPALRETCGDAAIYCDPRDPQNISDATLDFLSSAERRAAMKMAALQHAGSKTWKKSGAALEPIISSF
jgi:glycosyltransferase involved in cell wall biosynthesis